MKKRERIDKNDFKGLHELQQLAGKDLTYGVVLYRGKDAVPFVNNLWAIPIANLWA